MPIYKEFLGLNYCIYDPCEIDHGTYGSGSNTLGYTWPPTTGSSFDYWYTSSVDDGYVTKLTSPDPSRVLLLLNLHRNGPYGFPSWKQTRVSHNHLSRIQRKNNIFTYVSEPGNKYDITINGKQYNHIDRFGTINRFHEPVVVGSYKPLEVIGGMSFYNPDINQNEIKKVSIKTTFPNETVFFANDKPNQYYETIVETDESYEDFKELYLNGALEASESPIEDFDMMIFKQSVFPKMKYSYLEQTRARKNFVCSFWRNKRDDRSIEVSEIFGAVANPGHAKQSIWPLDARDNFATFGPPGETLILLTPSFQYMLGGEPSPQAPRTSFWIYVQFGSRGGSGILQNTYSQLYKGGINTLNNARSEFIGFDNALMGPVTDSDKFLTASVQYSKRHTLKNIHSFKTETGMEIVEITSSTGGLPACVQSIMIATSSLFLGDAAWDAGRQAGKNPFPGSYKEWAKDTRLVGKGYSIVPEFRISSHVETYESIAVTDELPDIFELSGAFDVNSTTATNSNFYDVYSTTDLLKHFDLVKKDHKDFVDPNKLTLRCKAIKKFLPYEGFYPAQRTVQIAKIFHEVYKDYIQYSTEDGLTEASSFGFQRLLEPLFAPGVLYNTIKSGVAVDYPVIHNPDRVSSAMVNACGFEDQDAYDKIGFTGEGTGQIWTNQMQNCLLTGSYTATASLGNASEWGDLWSVFDQRIPFEAIINPGSYLSNVALVNQDPHPWSGGDKSKVAIWSGKGGKKYSSMMSNFLAEVPEFFLKDQNFKTITSLESQDVSFGNAVSGNFYAMRVKMYRTKNRPNESMPGYGSTQVVPPQDLYGASRKSGKSEFFMRENFTMYSRTSAFGPPILGGGSGSYQNYDKTLPYGRFKVSGSDSLWGYNWAYTPPYYHGDGWCDLIFECKETKKYTVDEIVSAVREFPYYQRFWWNGHQQAMRDLTGYKSMWVNGTADAFSSSVNFLSLIRTGDDLGPGAPGLTGEQQTIEGPHRHYDNSPWRTLIDSGRFSIGKDPASPKGYIGMILPSLVATALLSSNYSYPPADYVGSGSPDFTMQYGHWGARWLLDGWAIKEVKYGGWLGPPEFEQYSASFSRPPYHPYYLNNNAMQLDASLNLFSIGTVRKMNLKGDGTSEQIEVATEETTKSKSRWIIQTKFETPMLNFNKYTDLSQNNCTSPAYGAESVPRGMWHQYGEIPEKNKGIFVQVEDLPGNWMRGAMGLNWYHQKMKVKSLADLVGMPKNPVRLGELPQVRKISECVVAVPFYEEDGERNFFTIPREEISEIESALRREVEPGVFVAGGPPKSGQTIIDMVKKMKKYVFPPSMDFIKYPEIEPFAMYIFEFEHNLDSQDVADIWQNLPPKIGEHYETSEVSISHELLAHELMGGGAKIVNNSLNENALGEGIRDDIQWMLFKVKKRARTNYFDKVVAKKGSTEDTSNQKLEGISESDLGENPDITYNWPYDFFSLVELVKLDAEVVFADVENDDKGNKVLKTKKKLDPALEGIRARMQKQNTKALGNPEDSE
jgi:hypothetical protein